MRERERERERVTIKETPLRGGTSVRNGPAGSGGRKLGSKSFRAPISTWKYNKHVPVN